MSKRLGIAHSLIISVTSFSKMVRADEKKSDYRRLDYVGEPRDGDGGAREMQLELSEQAEQGGEEVGRAETRGYKQEAEEKDGCLHRDGKNRESKVERFPGLGLVLTLR